MRVKWAHNRCELTGVRATFVTDRRSGGASASEGDTSGSLGRTVGWRSEQDRVRGITAQRSAYTIAQSVLCSTEECARERESERAIDGGGRVRSVVRGRGRTRKKHLAGELRACEREREREVRGVSIVI